MKKPLGAKRAVREGFEPPRRYERLLVFKTSAISQALPPHFNVPLINSLLSPLFLLLFTLLVGVWKRNVVLKPFSLYF